VGGGSQSGQSGLMKSDVIAYIFKQGAGGAQIAVLRDKERTAYLFGTTGKGKLLTVKSVGARSPVQSVCKNRRTPA